MANAKRSEPTEAYLEQATAPVRKLESEESRAKLLITDLNNCLLARKSRIRRHGLRPMPRPYLSTFLEYIARSDYKLMVWSSARPVNVENMSRAVGILPPVDSTARDPNLIALWTRDNLGLTPEQYDQKIEVVKDLEAVFVDTSLGSWTQANTVLLDDSTQKAILQPYNHLHLPIFDPFGTAGDSFDDEQQPPPSDASSSFVGRARPAELRHVQPGLRSDQINNWRRTSDWVSAIQDPPAEPAKATQWLNAKDDKREPQQRPAYQKPDPAVFANFVYKRKSPSNGDVAASSARYNTRSRSAQKTLDGSVPSFEPRGPTAWPFAAPSNAAVQPGRPDSRRMVPTTSQPAHPAARGTDTLSTRSSSDVVQLDTPSESLASSRTRALSETQDDTMLLRAIAALDTLSQYADVSAAIKSGILAGCFDDSKRPKTIEQRLAALWSDRRSDAPSTNEDDTMSEITATTAPTETGQKLDEWEARGRSICLDLGIAVRKEHILVAGNG